MALYIVRMDHPDGEAWNTHVLEHVQYLQSLIADGRLLASGPLKGTPLRAGFLIMKADSEAEVRAMVDDDPFTREGLIHSLTIEAWDPLFGMLSDHSSQEPPAELASLF